VEAASDRARESSRPLDGFTEVGDLYGIDIMGLKCGVIDRYWYRSEPIQ
jgi:hypothetical protein